MTSIFKSSIPQASSIIWCLQSFGIWPSNWGKPVYDCHNLVNVQSIFLSPIVAFSVDFTFFVSCSIPLMAHNPLAIEFPPLSSDSTASLLGCHLIHGQCKANLKVWPLKSLLLDMVSPIIWCMTPLMNRASICGCSDLLNLWLVFSRPKQILPFSSWFLHPGCSN